jgi:hypothetical protein
MDTNPNPSTYISAFAPPIPLTDAQVALLKAQYEERMYAKLQETQRQEEEKQARREWKRLEKERQKSCEAESGRGRLSLSLGVTGRRNCRSVDVCAGERDRGAGGDRDRDRGCESDGDGKAEEGRKGSMAFWRRGSKLKNEDVVR